MKLVLIKRKQRMAERKIRMNSLIFRRLFRPVIADQEARFMQRLPLITKPTYKNIMDMEQENHIVGLAMRPVYITAATNEADEIFEQFRVFVKAARYEKLFNQKIFDYSDKYSLAMAKYVNKSTGKKIKKMILQGFKENLSYRQIAKNIKTKIFKDLAQGYRSKLIAQTEAHGMIENGGFEAAKATKVAKEKTWSAAGDARETHGDANQQTVLLRDTFVVGGYLMNFPGDTSLGAALGEIINCRCSALYSSRIHKKKLTTSKDLLAKHEAKVTPRRGHLKNMPDERQIEQIMVDAKAAGKKLSYNEAATLRDEIHEFTSGTYKVVRQYETGGLKEIKGLGAYRQKQIVKMSKDLQEYLKYASKYEGQVMRNIVPKTLEERAMFANLKAGNIIDMKGTSFFTSSDDISSLFGNVQFVVKNPRTGVSVSHLSYFRAEGKEVLFRNGLKFRVVDVKEVIKEAVKYKEYRMFGVKALPKRKVLQITLEEVMPKVPKVIKPIIPKIPKVPKVTKEQLRKSLETYQDGGFQSINGRLRGEKIDPKYISKVKVDIANMDSLTMETVEDYYLYRGDGAGISANLFEKISGLPTKVAAEEVLHGKIAGKTYAKFLEGKMKGMTFTDNAFISASKNAELALEKFVGGSSELTKYGASGYVEIMVPKGTNLIDVEKVSLMGAGEGEMILARGTTFKIESINIMPIGEGRIVRFYINYVLSIVK